MSLAENRGHFFAAAAEAMRRILVDGTRRKNREKLRRAVLGDIPAGEPDPRHDLMALDAALTRLAAEDPQGARLVELWHFGGLTVPEAAQVMGIAPRTADRMWAFARAWLHEELTNGGGE
nr:ECF-type sigma factor [Zavarzinella formosa]